MPRVKTHHFECVNEDCEEFGAVHHVHVQTELGMTYLINPDDERCPVCGVAMEQS
jgi:hypothetical protein